MDRRIILGVDPSFTATGYALLSVEGNRVLLIEKGVLSLPSGQSPDKRLLLFYEFFHTKILSCGVTELALETPFLGKNVQNFLKLGYLRGILLLLAGQFSISVHEFAPRQVKLAVTGSGSADKEQVMRVIMVMFPRLEVVRYLDITDAIAVALCCLWKK